MAHLRKKEKWLAHAQAMIEGKSLAKTAKLCGVHPTTAFRWRHRFLRAPADDKPRSLSGIVEADETFILESFKGRWSDLPRKARKRGGTARHPGPYPDNIPVLVARDRKSATFDAVLPQDDNASIAAVLTGVVTPANHLVGDGGSRWPPSPVEPAFPSTLCPRRESRLPRRRTCTSTTSTPITDASSNGSIASTASPPRTCQATSAGAAPSKAGANALTRQTGSPARSEMDHTNRYRYKSRETFAGLYNMICTVRVEDGASITAKGYYLRSSLTPFLATSPLPRLHAVTPTQAQRSKAKPLVLLMSRAVFVSGLKTSETGAIPGVGRCDASKRG